MKIISDEDLINIIVDHLPIDQETTINFIEATRNGCFSDNINYALALSARDRVIDRLSRENIELRDRLYKIQMGIE
jgi:hypothetical protein